MNELISMLAESIKKDVIGEIHVETEEIIKKTEELHKILGTTRDLKQATNKLSSMYKNLTKIESTIKGVYSHFGDLDLIDLEGIKDIKNKIVATDVVMNKTSLQENTISEVGKQVCEMIILLICDFIFENLVKFTFKNIGTDELLANEFIEELINELT